MTEPKGGGQGAKQAGNDSAGSSSSADEGAGASQQRGAGDTAGTGGNKQQSTKPTGEPGSKTGDGSDSTPGKGDQPGGDPQQAPNRQDGGRTGEPGGRGRTGQGGGKAPEGDASRSGTQPIQDVADGEQANEAFSQEAVDLALDYLKHNPDDKSLMDKLNWSPADRKRFLDRWERLKSSAREGEDGKRQLSDALQGLGLRRGDASLRRQATDADAAGGLQQEGSGPAALPAHLLERFNAYKRGAAKSRD